MTTIFKMMTESINKHRLVEYKVFVVELCVFVSTGDRIFHKCWILWKCLHKSMQIYLKNLKRVMFREKCGFANCKLNMPWLCNGKFTVVIFIFYLYMTRILFVLTVPLFLLCSISWNRIIHITHFDKEKYFIMYRLHWHLIFLLGSFL